MEDTVNNEEAKSEFERDPAGVSAKTARALERVLGRPKGSLTTEVFDPGMEGRLAFEVVAVPPLTPAETETMRAFLRFASAHKGGRPPIFPDKC